MLEKNRSLPPGFIGSTPVVTNYGVHPFSDFSPGDKIMVQDVDGEWQDAEVTVTGKSTMYDVSLISMRKRVSITCTSSQLFPISENLAQFPIEGMPLKPLNDRTKIDFKTYEEKRLFCLGAAVAFCKYTGQKKRLNGSPPEITKFLEPYEHYFAECGYRIFEKDGRKFCANSKEISAPDFISLKGWRLLPGNLKAALFHGFFQSSRPTESPMEYSTYTVDPQIISMCEEISALAGYYIVTRLRNTHENAYVKNEFRLTYHTVCNLPLHRWYVKDISPHINSHKVQAYNHLSAWNIIQPKTNTFTLANGIAATAYINDKEKENTPNAENLK